MLFRELRDERGAAPFAVQPAAVLFLLAILQRKSALIEGTVEEIDVAAVKRAGEIFLIGHRAAVMKSDDVESHGLVGALPPISNRLPQLHVIGLEKVILGLRVVQDRKSGPEIELRRRFAHAGRAVVAGERVRIAEEERIAVRRGETPIEIAADRAADDSLHVLEAIERRRRDAVAFEKADRLPLHVRRLSGLQEKGRAGRTLEKIGIGTDAHEQFVCIDLPIARRRIAPIEPAEMHLRARGQPVAVADVELQLGSLKLDVTAGIGSLQKPGRLPRRKKSRRKKEADGMLLVVTPAIPAAKLELVLQRPTGLRVLRKRGTRERHERAENRKRPELHDSL